MSENPSDNPEDEDLSETGAEGEGQAGDGASAWSGGESAERIAALESELAETRDRLLRTAAEMDNLRKRTQREKEDAGRFAITGFARDIVAVSDNLARALDAVPAEARTGGDEMVATLVTGIEMTERQLQQVFERHGVRRFDPTGEKFDPTVHEAMFEVPDTDKPAGTVAHVVEPGYMIGERVLRPARVGVSAGGPRPAPDGPQAPGAGDDIGQIGIKVDRSA